MNHNPRLMMKKRMTLLVMIPVVLATFWLVGNSRAASYSVVLPQLTERADTSEMTSPDLIKASKVKKTMSVIMS